MTDTTKERAQQFEIKLRTTRFLRAELDICCQLPSEVADQIMELYRAEQSTETPPHVEQLAVDLCRELYDRFMMGGWTPEDAHAETVLRLQQWAEAPRPQLESTETPPDLAFDDVVNQFQCNHSIHDPCDSRPVHVKAFWDAAFAAGRASVAEAPRPVGTPEKCPTCGSVKNDQRWCPACYSGRGKHTSMGEPVCADSWHDGPVGTQTEGWQKP